MNYEFDVVKIVNLKQVQKYIEYGVKPIDIYVTDKIVFVFKKEDTKELFKKWNEYKLI